MKLNRVLRLSSVLCLGALALAAPETNQVEPLKKQLQELQESFQKTQQQQRQQIEALQKQLEALLQAGSTNRSAPAAGAPSAGVPPTQPLSPSPPITLCPAGSAYLNV